jgi:hypothetical protein
MNGLDGRHRDKDGRIEAKHGSTKVKNLTEDYPSLKVFDGEVTLAEVKEMTGTSSLSQAVEAAKLLRP